MYKVVVGLLHSYVYIEEYYSRIYTLNRKRNDSKYSATIYYISRMYNIPRGYCICISPLPPVVISVKLTTETNQNTSEGVYKKINDMRNFHH